MGKRININENSFNKLFANNINEISYGTVEKAKEKNDKLFWEVQSNFEDFYASLKNAIITHSIDRNEGEDLSNSYLDKIKVLADKISIIIAQKRKQFDNFQNELDKFDYNKFYDDMSDREDYEDYDDMELRDLQNKYPR